MSHYLGEPYKIEVENTIKYEVGYWIGWWLAVAVLDLDPIDVLVYEITKGK